MAETLRSPTAPATEDEFEIELPEDEEPVVPEGAAETEDQDEPEPESKPEPEAKKPAPPKEVTPEPEPEPVKAEEPEPEPEPEPKRRLTPIEREERTKRKGYMKLYAETKEQLDAAERTIRLLREQPTDPNDPNLARWHKELAEEASKATDLADVLKLTLKEMDRRDRVSRRELNVHLYQLQCDISESRARSAHPDFEQVCAKAGIFDAIQTDQQGQFRDPAIANRVYYTQDKKLAPDPAERMYRLAVGKLEYEKSLKGEDEPEPEPEPATKSKGKDSKPKAEPKADVEAERRGAQRVIEVVSKNSTRPRGIRSLPKASAGPTRVSKQYLDELLDTNPTAYERLIQRNPDLERWHLG